MYESAVAEEQRYSSTLLKGVLKRGFGNSPGWWAATQATPVSVSDHKSEKSYCMKAYSVRDQPKIDHIADKTIYPRAI